MLQSFLKELNNSLLIELALKEYGVKEIKGKEHNERILEYSKTLNVEWVQSDETSWCSIFTSFIAFNAGLEYPKSKVTARHWLEVGINVKTPRLGDIVVFWRESIESWKGHVGFYISEDEENIFLLGGNQSNQVCIKPYAKKKLLGYRRLKTPR